MPSGSETSRGGEFLAQPDEWAGHSINERSRHGKAFSFHSRDWRCPPATAKSTLPAGMETTGSVASQIWISMEGGPRGKEEKKKSMAGSGAICRQSIRSNHHLSPSCDTRENKFAFHTVAAWSNHDSSALHSARSFKGHPSFKKGLNCDSEKLKCQIDFK